MSAEIGPRLAYKWTPARPVMRSAAHRLHAALGATFEPRMSWEVPAVYSSQQKEVDALQTDLGFADISARGKVYMTGAVDHVIRVLTGASLEPQRIALTEPAGTAARLARDWGLVLTGAGGQDAVLDRLGAQALDDAMAADMTSGLSGFLVAGPRLEDFLARTVTVRIEELRPGWCRAASWAKIPASLVVRESTASAAEIYVSSDYGHYAWETIRELGERLGGQPVGWGALEMWGWR
jgi:glycine cleavage system aminomethyltransferase T